MDFFSIVLRIVLPNLLNLFVVVLADRCCQIGRRESPIFKLSGHEKRSIDAIISRKFVVDLDKCEMFAVSKKALAFNYRRSTGANRSRRDDWNHANCQALQCPVTNDFTKLINDASFDYYSIYRSSVFPESENLKCVPKVGIFHISEERKNYTNARASCRKMRATLAHVASEERTEELGKIISKIPTFVGLGNRGKERIWKNEFDEPLSCFDYRGWAEGEPANSRGCVVLVPPGDSHSSSSWRVSRCSRELPYVCEIMPRSRGRRRHRQDDDKKS